MELTKDQKKEILSALGARQEYYRMDYSSIAGEALKRDRRIFIAVIDRKESVTSMGMIKVIGCGQTQGGLGLLTVETPVGVFNILPRSKKNI